MISHRYRFVFIHIPKTGGQSVEHFFLSLHGMNWRQRAPLLLRYNPDPARGPERLAHLRASEYARYGYISDEKYQRYFKFSFVRNPWARLVSEYRYRGMEKECDFRTFVTTRLPPPSAYSDAYRHIMPQYDFLHDDTGRLCVDFVGRYENLDDDFSTVCEKLGIENTGLPRVNPSPVYRPDANEGTGVRTDPDPAKAMTYAGYYDTELERLVAEKYAADIAAFGYEFGG